MNELFVQQRLEALLEAPPAPLPPLPPAGAEFLVYGAGNCGREVMAVLRNHGYNIAAVLDARAAVVGPVSGVPCLAPDSAAARAFAARGLPVVIGVFNYATDIGGIESRLVETGFARVISYFELFERFPHELAARFWLAPRIFYHTQRGAILQVFSQLMDDPSRAVFLEALELRLKFDLQVLRRPDPARQYFPADLPLPASGIRLVDGGAFVGDTLQNFLTHHQQFEAVAAFEPDLANFAQLVRFAETHRAALGETFLLPCGLGETTAMHRFTTGHGEGSLLAADGNSFVQVVALDDVLPTLQPNLIKLDIEGAEPAALRGAAETIRRSAPNLAVCLYHAAEHLWTLPQLMRELAPRHKLALRYHQFNGLEIVAYAFRD